MRVFVAGGTGVIGRRVVDRLVADGHQVTGVARTDERAAVLRALGADPRRVDLFDPEAVRRAVAGHDAVVNMATQIPPASRAGLRRAWRANDRLRTEASRNLVDGALAGGVPTVVQESVTFLYDDGGSAWLDEAAGVSPVAFTASALDAEGQLARFSNEGGRGVVLRFGQFVAPDSEHMQDLVRMVRRGRLPLLGSEEGYETFIHADDAADAAVAALDAPAGIYNVAEDEPMTRAEHVAAFAAALGREVRLLPAWLGSVPRLSFRARSQRVSNRRLKEATGWAPVHHDMSSVWPALIANVEVPARA